MMEKKTPAKLSKKRKDNSKSAKRVWIFMTSALFLLLLVFLINKEKGMEATRLLGHLLLEILPVLLLVFVLMVLMNVFLKTKSLAKFLGEESGLKGWLIAIVTGIISMGAIYMWYPLLKEVMDKGAKPGLVSVFLYNRGIKLHFLPLMALYFGLKYVVILTFVTILVSVLQGIIIDFFLSKKRSR